MFKKRLCLILSLLIIISSLSACKRQGGQQASANEIRIGAVFPFTGDAATYGQSSKNSLELLLADVNAKGGILGKKVRIIYEDDANQPTQAANALQKLINNDRVAAVIGTTSSKACIAMGPIAAQNKIPMITATATNPKVTLQGGGYVFRATFIDPFQGTVIAKFASTDLKAKTAAVLYDVANDYSTGLADAFRTAFEGAGGRVVDAETYSTGDQDFSAQLTKIKAAAPDVLVLPDYYNVVGLIAKQARALGIKSTFMGGDGWDSPDLFKVGGTAIEGGYFSNHYSPQSTLPQAVAFVNAYKAKYNATPDAFGALAYDAGQILFNAITKAGSTDGVKIRDAMAATDLTVVSGRITFNKNGDPIKPAVMLKTESGKAVYVRSVTP